MWQKLKNIYHLFTAIAANFIFWFPAKKLNVIGVTGTDGKTTTVSLIYHILKESGQKVSMLTSIGAMVGDKKYDTGFHVTTPDSFSLQKILRRAVSAKSKYFILEVTSHAIDQHRIWGVPFAIAVVTNITSEHLDYHKNYDKYLKTKAKLLKLSKTAIVNRDDLSYKFLKEEVKNNNRKNWITYGLTKDCDVNPYTYPQKNIKGLDEFNKYNLLAAIAVCRTLGLDKEKIDKAISTFKMPLGRVDLVYEKKFKVMIDFAHTPNAFEKVLSSLRKKVKGRIIHVFGSAGERDSAKRPVLGEISSRYTDIIVLTAEDPRSESASKIIEEIAEGIKKAKVKVLKIPDRKEAINAAIRMAAKDDLVIITGKAHERSINYGKGEEPWNEYEVVKQALSKIQ